MGIAFGVMGNHITRIVCITRPIDSVDVFTIVITGASAYDMGARSISGVPPALYVLVLISSVIFTFYVGVCPLCTITAAFRVGAFSACEAVITFCVGVVPSCSGTGAFCMRGVPVCSGNAALCMGSIPSCPRTRALCVRITPSCLVVSH